MSKGIIGWLLLFLSVVIGLALFLPKASDVHTLAREKKVREAVLKVKSNRVAALRSLKPNLQQSSARVNKLVEALPQDPQLPEILVTLESMGKESGVTLRSILPQVNTREQKVTITMVGDGEFASIENLMGLVAQNSRPMTVASFSMLKPQGNSKSLSFNLGVSVPYRAAELKASPAPGGQL